jgi:hypothetical protein
MLLPFGEQTVIGTVFDGLERDERIDDVYVSTNEKFAAEFETYLDDSPYQKPQLSVEETTAESEKFGVIGAINQLIERENLTDDTLVIAGDNLICFDVSDFLDAFEANDEPTLAAYDVGSYERASSYGLVELADTDEVIDFQEKPAEPNSTLVSIACYGFPSETLSLFAEYLEGDNNPDEPVGSSSGFRTDRLSARLPSMRSGSISERPRVTLTQSPGSLTGRTSFIERQPLRTPNFVATFTSCGAQWFAILSSKTPLSFRRRRLPTARSDDPLSTNRRRSIRSIFPGRSSVLIRS